jgi:hypothetical protein
MSKFHQELTKHRKTNLKEGIKEFLDEESYEDFKKALENKLVPASSIVTALKSFGIEVSDNTIRRWRNGQ